MSDFTKQDNHPRPGARGRSRTQSAALVILAFCLILSAGVPAAHAQRQTIELRDGWKFLRQDTLPLAKTDGWETVSVPHTWNTVDGANGLAADPQSSEGYYRGPAWYARALDIPEGWKGKRVFIRFEGVALVADVFVNGISIGQHRGGYAAFCHELTPWLHFDGRDTLRVRVDNARAFDVAPLSGDFTLFGGIYRPVRLFATDTVCISPLHFASPGVFLTLRRLTGDTARVEAKTFVSSGAVATSDIQVEVEIKDAAGAIVASEKTGLELPAGAEGQAAQVLTIPHPHLWNGRKDPYLYMAAFHLLRDGSPVDEVVQPLGIRTVALDAQRGFLLNAEPYPLRGVNRHQERAGKGTAISDSDQAEDHAMILELGATAVRLAHYQQAEAFHELSDRAGLIEWQEIPLVDTVGGSPQFLANARQQLTEMILQCYNHPAIGLWGLFNELDPKWAQVKTAPAAPLVADLQKLAKELDPARQTVAASFPEDAGAKHRIPDGMAWNIYPGWYAGAPEDAAGMIAKYSSQMGGRRIGISEYVAGANPLQFQEGVPVQPAAGGAFHPQEWQNHFHETLWAQLKDNPKLFGTWAWVMFDFAVDKRNEGGVPGLNDKGLVTRDRKIRKDTFYFYKANWNAEPMARIASRRATPRRDALTEVKAYSNCAEVELRLNGESLGTKTPNDIKVVLWPQVTLRRGANHLEISARAGWTSAARLL